jgi:hypothetical protein
MLYGDTTLPDLLVPFSRKCVHHCESRFLNKRHLPPSLLFLHALSLPLWLGIMHQSGPYQMLDPWSGTWESPEPWHNKFCSWYITHYKYSTIGTQKDKNTGAGILKTLTKISESEYPRLGSSYIQRWRNWMVQLKRQEIIHPSLLFCSIRALNKLDGAFPRWWKWTFFIQVDWFQC